MCHHCGQTLTIDYMLLECAVLRGSRDEYYTADSLNTLFETIPETCIVEFLREAGFFYLIWMVRHSIQSLTWTIPKLKQFFNFMYATSDMNGHISSTTLYLDYLATDKILNLTTPPGLFVEDKQIWENPTCEGRLIYREGCVSLLKKSNLINCCDMFWTEDHLAALVYCQGHPQSAICGWPANLFSWALNKHYRETFTAGSECNTGIGDKEWFQVCSPQIQSHTFHYTPI